MCAAVRHTFSGSPPLVYHRISHDDTAGMTRRIIVSKQRLAL